MQLIMKEFTSAGRGLVAAVILCLAFVVLLLTGLCHCMHRREVECQRKRAFFIDRMHGKIILPGIRHPNSMAVGDYSVYFPEMAQ